MIRNLFIALFVVIAFASCSSMRPTNSTNNKQTSVTTPSKPAPDNVKKNDIKFLDDISSNPQLANSIPDAKTEKPVAVPAAILEKSENNNSTINNSAGLSNTSLKEKYALLLETETTELRNIDLLKGVDEWYGTKYRMGGTNKTGIDCSAFVQAVYLTAFGLAIPRTAFEQFKASNRVSATEMKEGDLVFFNTTGGVSHVGIYMGNNKFAHASVARGVTISDLFDPYYLKRFLGIGRPDRSTTGTH